MLDWSPTERALVQASWRQSTVATYKAPIRKWLKWCNENEVNPKAPRGEDLARFLAGLFNTERLSYATILLHKSAIINFCAGGPETSLASNFLVRQVLNGISIKRPREIRSFVWDAQILLDWLKKPVGRLSLFETSRRAATVLLLASGRRIHDLTLLRTGSESFEETRDSITL